MFVTKFSSGAGMAVLSDFIALGATRSIGF